jgi:hypothetical protein
MFTNLQGAAGGAGLAVFASLVDWTHVGRTTIDRNARVTIRIAPLVSRATRGLRAGSS